MTKLTKLIRRPRRFFVDAINKRVPGMIAVEKTKTPAPAALVVQCTSPSIVDTIAGRKIPGMKILPAICGKNDSPQPGTQAIIGWGQKASGSNAARHAETHGLILIRGEDGFIRSIRRDGPTLSFLFDRFGMHFDPATPSIIDVKLEKHADGILRGAKLARIHRLKQAIVAGRVSKYNGSRDPETLPDVPYVLVLDQARDDASVLASGGTTEDFVRMLARARKDYPAHRIIVRSHPDKAIGKSAGYFEAEHIAAHKNIEHNKGSDHLCALLDGADHVYVYSSQTGFEALIRGKKVSCFGTPFFAHRGLTRDFGPKPAYDRKPCRLETMIHVALIDAPIYYHPETGEKTDVETVVAHIARHREITRDDPEAAVLVGFSKKKTRTAQRFLPMTRFVSDPAEIAASPKLPVISWGRAWEKRDKSQAGILFPRKPERVILIEDGFTRSRGLGAAFVDPISWIVDPTGIHFDFKSLSSIELKLLTHRFTAAERERAADYRMKLLELAISKYNLNAGKAWSRPAGLDKKVILVPGQVESDASIKYGSPTVKTNRALLEAVRKRNPDAYILYRPHPDVLGGYRPGDPKADAKGLADAMDVETDIHEVLKQVDAVETMTSLTGMEALLRGLKVTCHGAPFYAGWGLTEDLVKVHKRTRRLTLDELVWGSYLAAPRFVGPTCGEFVSAEQAMAALSVKPEPKISPIVEVKARVAGHWRESEVLKPGLERAIGAARSGSTAVGTTFRQARDRIRAEWTRQSGWLSANPWFAGRTPPTAGTTDEAPAPKADADKVPSAKAPAAKAAPAKAKPTKTPATTASSVRKTA